MTPMSQGITSPHLCCHRSPAHAGSGRVSGAARWHRGQGMGFGTAGLGGQGQILPLPACETIGKSSVSLSGKIGVIIIFPHLPVGL